MSGDGRVVSGCVGRRKRSGERGRQKCLLKELIERKLKKGLSVEEIAEILEADLETVRTLIEERN